MFLTIIKNPVILLDTTHCTQLQTVMFGLECLCKYLRCLSPSCLSKVYSCHSAWKEIKVWGPRLLPQGWFTCHTTTTDTAVYWSLSALNILSLAVRQITPAKRRQLGQYQPWQSCLQVLVAYPCSIIMSKLMLSWLFKSLCLVHVILGFVWSTFFLFIYIYMIS